MKIGHRAKFGLLIAFLLGTIALLWLWQRMSDPEPAMAGKIPADPARMRPVVQRQTGASAASAIAPAKPAARSAESIAEAAYHAAVLANQAKREEGLLALVNDLTPENAGAFLEELMRSNRTAQKPGQTVWNAFWKKWGAIDGRACMDELISRGQSNRITSDGVLAMEGWAAADPQGAAEWLKTEQPDLPIWNAAWAAWQITSRGGDPLAATPDILTAADTPAKTDAAAQQLADIAQIKGGADALTQWFDTVPATNRPGVVNHFLYRLISSDPQAAVNFMTRNAQAPWRDDRHAGKLIREISRQDPAGTATWAATLHPSPAGTPLDQTPIFQAASRWAESDPAKARAWLDANSHQPWVETARAGYTRSAPETRDDLRAE
jgi:hypothetical protein